MRIAPPKVTYVSFDYLIRVELNIPTKVFHLLGLSVCFSRKLIINSLSQICFNRNILYNKEKISTISCMSNVCKRCLILFLAHYQILPSVVCYGER